MIAGNIAAGAGSGSPYTVTIQAGDGVNSASLTFDWTVNVAGVVTLANPGGQANYEGDSVSLALSATDSGSGTLQYAAFGLPAGLAISSSTGLITGTIALGAAAYGPYTVTVVANDGTYSAMQTFTWGVSSPITLTAPADQTNNEGDTVSLPLAATDYSTGTLSYAAFGLPAGLQIDSSTGVISGTVAAGDAANVSYSVTIMAGDGTFSATQTFNWNINSLITLTAPADQTNNEGATASLSVSASASGTLSYSALGLPAGLAINPSTGAITGTIALGNSGIGYFAPIITVGNGTSIASQSFNWYVNGAVTLTSPGDQANTVGDTVTLAIQATDSGSGTLVYAASGLPAGLAINTSTGLITGTITASAGSYTTTVTAGDGTATATQSFNWTVSPAGVVTMATPSNQSDSEGATVSLTVSATNWGSGSLTYFAAGLPAGLSIDPGTGAITGTMAVGDAAYSPYYVVVTASNGAAAPRNRSRGPWAVLLLPSPLPPTRQTTKATRFRCRSVPPIRAAGPSSLGLWAYPPASRSTRAREKSPARSPWASRGSGSIA